MDRWKDRHKPCPFAIDDAPFAARSTGMSLDVIRPEDVPRGRPLYCKDYDRSLITQDIHRAQPVLAHPTSGNAVPMPFSMMTKPELEEPELSKAQTKYPFVHPNRPVDLSLTAADIEEAQPKKTGMNSEGRKRADVMVDPVNPVYGHMASTALPPEVPRASGKCTLDISDIEKTNPTPLFPERLLGDPLKDHTDFQSMRHVEALELAAARDRGDPAACAPPLSTRRACLTPRREGPQKSQRCTDPLDPRYRVHLGERGATSMHTWWSEEKGLALHQARHAQQAATAMGPAGTISEPAAGEAVVSQGRARANGQPLLMRPAAPAQEIGSVDGAHPKPQTRDNGQPQLSLESRDVLGAEPTPRVGGLALSIYGPRGQRPVQPGTLVTEDIEGAQASTRPRFPKCHMSNAKTWGAAIVGTPRKLVTVANDDDDSESRGAAGSYYRGPRDIFQFANTLPAERGRYPQM